MANRGIKKAALAALQRMMKQHRGDREILDNVPDWWSSLEHQIDARVLELHAEGASVEQIAQLTGVHPRRIRRLLPPAETLPG